MNNYKHLTGLAVRDTAATLSRARAPVSPRKLAVEGAGAGVAVPVHLEVRAQLAAKLRLSRNLAAPGVDSLAALLRAV